MMPLPFNLPLPYPLPPRGGSDWAEVLEPGERVLWEGRPHPGFLIRWKHLPLLLVSLVFVGLAGYFTWQALAGLRAGAEGAVEAVAAGCVMVAFGLGAAIWPPVSDMLRRRGTSYALTDRRALIETDYFGLGLAACDITPQSPLLLARDRPPSAIFTVIQPSVTPMARALGPRRRQQLIGFECITNAREVLELMRKVQEGTA